MLEPNNAMLETIPYLRRYARALTNNTRLADRIVQQCLDCAADLRQFVRQDHGDSATQKLWLFSIFHNIYNEFINEQQAIVDQLNDAMEDHLVADSEAATIHPPGNDNHDEYQLALMQLPLLQQQIFLLVCVEKFLYEEVGQIVNLPLGAVLSLLHSARESLADKVYSPHKQGKSGKGNSSDELDTAQFSAEKGDALGNCAEDHLEKIL
jgi:RNA polymerase sigma-70 factor (ECF subfamily)